MKKRIFSAIFSLALFLNAIPVMSNQSMKEPIVWYTFDEVNDDNTISSEMGGFSLKLFGNAKIGEGKYNNALILDGNNSYAELENSIMKDIGDFSITAWIYMNSTAAWQRVFDIGNGTQEYFMFTPYTSWESPRATFSITKESNQNEKMTYSKNTIPTGSWHHVAITLNGYEAILYLDGEEQGRNMNTSLQPKDIGETLNNYIGRSNWENDPYFNGKIDDFRIYDYVLSEEEVAIMGDAPMFSDVDLENLKKINVYKDSDKKTLILPMEMGSDLTNLAPMFTTKVNVKVEPENASSQDFSKGSVKYTFYDNSTGRSQEWQVFAKEYANPVLNGYYADPQVAVFDDKYYIYPTSDGFADWSGYYFKCFSSSDLVEWKDEGVILDLKEDVEWSDKNAWAPTIIEKDGKYYYYFSAYYTKEKHASIGVAVADNPTGPFVAQSEPILPFYGNGQEIDAAAFLDPVSGKYYLYWGNGYLRVAELNDDMLSIKLDTVKLITPKEYNEGTYVIYRNGIYYFMWSQNDTRDINYQVRYGTSTSPYGPIEGSTIILEKNTDENLLGTGHHSVLNIPGTDKWYIIYHRHAYPVGGGFNREVCIEEMTFDEQGNINKIIPTKEGIVEPVTFKSTSLELKENDSKNITLKFTNNSSTSDNFAVILSQYNEENKLAGIELKMISADIGDSEQISFTLSETAKDKVKIFVCSMDQGKFAVLDNSIEINY